MEINQNIFESLYISDNLPLDKKTIVSSLVNLNTEIPLNHRYLGLVFYSKLEKKLYIFKNDINSAELLINDLNVSNIFGIYVENYSEILTELNNFTSLGKTIFVFPLNVAFVYDGIKWNYLSGIYNLRTGVDFNNLPSQIKQIGVKVSYENSIKIWNETLTLSDYILKTNNTDNINVFENISQPIEDRLYLHRSEYYKVINGKKVKIGNYNKEVKNFTINIGLTKIDEILFLDNSETNLPPYLNPLIWINKYATVKSKDLELIPLKLDYKIVKLSDKFEVYAISDNLYLGTLEIRA